MYMNSRGKIILATGSVAMAFVAVSVLAAQVDRARYAVIEQKCPFGKPPQPSAVITPAQAESQKKDLSELQTIRLFFIRRSETGVRCGLHDSKSNTSATLRVGELDPTMGITLADADYQNGSATIQKGTVQTTVYLDGIARSGSTGSASSANTAVAASNPSGTPSRPRRRGETIRHRPVEPPKMTGEELEKHLQNTQMDLIRNGDPPLPIPLTPEMDEQLVQEGVLPAAE